MFIRKILLKRKYMYLFFNIVPIYGNKVFSFTFNRA